MKMKKTHTLVMIPGPTPVVEPIRAEMAREIQAFGDPRFVASIWITTGSFALLFLVLLFITIFDIKKKPAANLS